MTLKDIKKDSRYSIEQLPCGFYYVYIACFEGRQISVHDNSKEAWLSCLDHFNKVLES